MTWLPILDGDLALRARAAVAEIATRLRSVEPSQLPAGAQLSSGTAGLAVFFAYLAETSEREEDLVRAGYLLEESMRELTHTAHPYQAMLHGGYAGIGWAIEHVAGEEGEDDPAVSIDRALLRLEDDSWAREFDLIDGLAGLLVYAVERLPRPAAHACIDRFVLRLDQLSAFTEAGRTWPMPAKEPVSAAGRALRAEPAGLDREDQSPAGKPAPVERYRFGVAHGVAGVIGALAAVCREIDHPPARRLLDGAVAWLLAQRCAPGRAAEFPYEIEGDTVRVYANQGWCVGDPGVAATLLSAARAAGRPDWARTATEVALAAARRHASAQVKEPGLCHGAAGLAHLFNRLYQATGEPALADAARRWFASVLELYRPGEGQPGFLNGDAGIGLALLAAVSDVEPLWDRVLAVAVPPR